MTSIFNEYRSMLAHFGIDLSNRVACAIACPYYTYSPRVLDEYWYPSLYERWHMQEMLYERYGLVKRRLE